MATSKHCSERMQQRSIPQMMLTLLLDFGSTYRSHGADCLVFDRAAKKRLRHHMGGTRGLHVIGPWLGIYAVVGDDGTVVTAGHRQKRLWRT